METSNTLVTTKIVNPNKPVPAVTDAKTRGHHKYGPSKLGYIDKCAAFKSVDGETNEAAEQGTFLHDIMEKMLSNVKVKKFTTTLEQISKWVTGVHSLTEEEIDYLRFCCKRCDIFIARKPTDMHFEIDVEVRSDAGKKLNHGFLDVLFIFGDIGILQDFKFGWEPVDPAPTNLQGMCYALGSFQLFRNLNKVGVEFIQPKLNSVSSALYERRQMSEMYDRLSGIVAQAETVQANPQEAQKYMKPGSYCKYCDHAPACTALANYRGMAVAKYQQLPMPVSFKGLELTKPEDVALARYWSEIAETMVDDIKKRATEIAEANGGSISCVLPNGEVILYEMMEKGHDRKLGPAIEVADALKEVLTQAEVLGAAELSLGRLEAIVKSAMVEAAAASGQKLTKKAAWEQTASTLEANGLLSRPDGKVRFLKLKKQVKQIQNQTENK